MYEAEDLENHLLPDYSAPNHLSALNGPSSQQYQISLQRSNIMSNSVLEKMWKTNADRLNQPAMEHLLSSAKSLTKHLDMNKMQSWKSSLDTFADPQFTDQILFEQTVQCIECNAASVTCINQNYLNLECTCNLGLSNTLEKKDNENRPLLVKTINLDSSQESKSGDERQNFKPRFSKKPLRHPASLKKVEMINEEYVERDTEDIQVNQQRHNPAKLQHNNTQNMALNIQEVDLDKVEEENKAHKSSVAKITFKTAKEQLLASNPAAKRTLGASRKAQCKFVSPMIGAQDKQEAPETACADERLKHIDPKMVELIESEIIDKGTPIGWDDIAGLSLAKSVIQEAVVWPLLRPDIFTGLRRPPKGILLFGPPGTGKTLIGKCIASQCRATFFSISASSLTSKWIGDGEKMVRALFAVARCHQPAVVFIDEIDSLLSARGEAEHEATRRIKTEFLVQLDGAATADEDRLLVVGATNRPQELDEAARRRLVKRLYIPLPDRDARDQIISNLLKDENSCLSAGEVADVAALTEGYSGADMRSLCAEAAMGPVRAVPLHQIATIQRDMVRPVNIQDFKAALQRVRPSVSQDDLGQYVKWNNTYGQGF